MEGFKYGDKVRFNELGLSNYTGHWREFNRVRVGVVTKKRVWIRPDQTHVKWGDNKMSDTVAVRYLELVP